MENNEKKGRLIGYVRVSTEEQNLDRQLAVMGDVDVLYKDKMSGKNTNREGLQKMFADVREGDTIRVKSIDRLARSTRDLLTVLDDMEKRGVEVEFIDTPYLNTNSKEGRFFVTILGALAEMERKTILERQAEGIALAKERGVYKKRAEEMRAFTPEQVAEIRRRFDDGEAVAAMAREFGVSRITVYKALNFREGCYAEGAYADIPQPKRKFKEKTIAGTPLGRSSSKPTLTPEQVAEARIRYKNGETMEELKNAFGITQVSMARAVRGRAPYDTEAFNIIPAC